MTYEEAFAILRDTPIDIRIPWNCEIYTQYATAQSIALDCIEKQMPKKCRHNLPNLGHKYKYCPFCGQRLDRSEV